MSEQAIKDLAREYTRRTLAQSATFHQLGVEDQKSLYLDVYRQNYQNLAHNTADYVQAKNLPVAMADPKAGDMINDKRHTNQRIDQAGDLAGGFIDEVDFPGFVKDLLKGVFDANLDEPFARADILGLNFARVHGLDVDTLAEQVGADDIEQRKTSNGLAEPWSKL